VVSSVNFLAFRARPAFLEKYKKEIRTVVLEHDESLA
jgi:hypothetical protein